MLSLATVLILCILSVSQAQKEEKDWTKLTLSTGVIRGRKFVTENNITAYLFHGVPYAEPPLGDLRYRAPVDKKPWKGELDTTTYKYACMTARKFDINLLNARPINEDCLHLNIFTAEKCLVEKNCPVIYYIYGGQWNNNNPFMFPDDLIIENYQARGIILVTVGYRLGTLGFFNTGKRTSAVKNLGLIDMIHGLKWTQREIGAFGGDKNKVTFMGHSSGATAVDIISISPLTAGLFHQLIVMSGPAIVSTLHKDNNYNESRWQAVLSGCATEEQWDAGDSFEDILDCLRKKSATELIDIQRTLEDDGNMFWGPVIDEEDGVLPQDIPTMLSKRRPYRQLIGTTNREIRSSKVIIDKEGKINQPLLSATCVLLARNRGLKHPVAIGRACAEDYSKRPSEIADLTDDLSYYVPSFESGAALRSKGATVYTYSFEYDQVGDAQMKKIKDAFNIESPAHGEDLVYGMGLKQNKFTEKDKKIQEVYSGMFADFVKTGDPSSSSARKASSYYIGKFQPTDERNNYYKVNFDDNMNIPGNTDGYHANAVNFWTKVAPELDQSYADWDMNDMFSLKKVTQDLIQGLENLGGSGAFQAKMEMKQWKKDLEEWSELNYDQIEQILNDIWQRIEDAGGFGKDDDDDDRRRIVQQNRKQLIRQSLPSVRDEPIGLQGTNWNLWFWVATAIAFLLAVFLLATCFSICHQHKKRNQYERLNETSGLNPSSATTYGAKYL